MTTVYAVDQIFVIAADAFARCSANSPGQLQRDRSRVPFSHDDR